jgi:hypothetical protein
MDIVTQIAITKHVVVLASLIVVIRKYSGIFVVITSKEDSLSPSLIYLTPSEFYPFSPSILLASSFFSSGVSARMRRAISLNFPSLLP